MALPLPPEYALGAPGSNIDDKASTNLEITLNIKFHGIKGEKNIQQSLKFSAWCLAEEAVEQIVPFFLKQDIIESTPTEVETNFMSYSLFLGNTYLHKDKSLVELQLQDGAEVTLKYEGQIFTLIKVQLPPNLATSTLHFATFKVTRRTPVRSALKRLYLRFCEGHDVLAYGIAPIETGQQGTLLDIDSFLVDGTTIPRLVYRAPTPADPSTAQRSLNLTVLVRAAQGTDDTARVAWRSVHMKFNPQDLVAKAIRQFDVVAGPIDNFGHCGFFVTPPPDEDGEERGHWLAEDNTLESYNLTEEDMIEYRPHFKSYKIHLPDNTFVFHKFDQDATVKTLLDILCNNQNVPPKSLKNFGLYPTSAHNTGMSFEAANAALDPTRTLWSYDTTIELRFREHLHPITVFFFERTQDTLNVDFSLPVEKVLPTILSRFRIVIPAGIPAEPSPISLRKLGGHELDRSRSLRQLNINPGDGLLLKVAVGFEAVLGLEPSYEMPLYRRPPPPIAPKNSKNKNDGKSPRSGHAKALPPVPGEEVNIWEESPSADHVSFDSNNKLQAGTLNKLVERLTSETAPDLEFMKAFLMTYQSFTTARRLLSKIFERFRVPPHIESTQKLSIQVRVCNVIKYWVEHHYVDFNHNMTQEIVAFVDLEIAELLPGAARNLRNAVLKRTCDIKTDAIKKASSDDDSPASTPTFTAHPGMNNTNLGKASSLPNLPSALRASPIPHDSPPYSPSFAHSPPISPVPVRKGSTAVSSKAQRTLGVSKDKVTSPIATTTPSNSLSFDKWRPKKKRGSLNLSKERSSPTPTSIWDFDEEEIAQQLTLIDFELYQSIRPTEFLNQAWNKTSTQYRSPNLNALIARFNLIGLWVSHQILREERLRGRIKKMDKLIKVAEHLYHLNNFSSVMAFLGGLNNSSILRLKFTKSGIAKRSLDFLDQLEKDMSSEGSFIKYRSVLRTTTPPCMPYVGVHLSDLVFVDEGNPDTITCNSCTLVNFSKYLLIHKVITDTLQYQHTTYQSITPVPYIQSFLRNLTPPLEKDLYAISLLREPRGASKAEIL